MLPLQTADIDKLSKALSDAQAEFPVVGKDDAGNFGKFASKKIILSKIYPILKKYELSINTQLVYEPDSAQWIIACFLNHASGQYKVSYAPHERNPNQKNQDFAWGGSVTYRTRYLIANMLGVCIDDESDTERSNDEFILSEYTGDNDIPLYYKSEYLKK